ncbi:MAG: 50S ribosomal protein L25/general stress protein Ctc [Pelagibacteraceae bacterium TMED232]|nr:MAG: 50S ribosomal protein L25/general stress protein Ctc [Pelagibacteraceae bacterium TMED232]
MNNLKAAKRETKTKGQLNSLRSKGFIPAILYGGKTPNLKLTIEEKFVKDVLKTENFLSTVFDLDIDGQKEKVIPREVTYHVTSEQPTHIDFMRVVKGSTIILEIPVKFKNNEECSGLKKGGVLNIVRRKIELKCQAESIPEDIEVDLSGLDIGASIRISSVKLPSNSELTITDRDFVVATIAAPTIVKEPEKPAEETTAEGAEGESTTAEAGETAAPAKEGEAAKKDEKAKEGSADKKPATEKKPQEKK